MIYVDDRAGSVELADPLQRRGLPVELTRLDFGDVAFLGRGEHDTPVWVGLEFKLLPDFIASVRTERLQGYQLPGMRECYPFGYLLLEGDIQHNATGALVSKGAHGHSTPMHGKMTITELYKRLLVLHLRGGLTPLVTTCRRDTLALLEALYRTWTDVPLDQHTSHLGVYQAPSLVPMSPFRQAVCMWPGIGQRMSRAVEQAFGGSLVAAANGTIDQWAQIETTSESGRTKRFGRKSAEALVRFLQGRTG